MTSPLFDNVLFSFEQQPLKPLLENEIYNLIQKQIPEGYSEFSMEEMAELIAFRFLEPSKSKHRNADFYFKPLSITKNEDGNLKEFPSVSLVTTDIIAYWSSRLEQTNHPVLAARYAGLVYDMSLHVTASRPSYLISKRYIESLLDLLERKLYKVSPYAIGKVERALEVALSLNNLELVEKCKIAIFNLEKDIAIPDKPGLWGFAFDLLVNGKKKLVSEAEEITIVKKLEGRFSEMLMTDSWSAECAAKRLMKYYYGKKQPQETKRIICELEKSYSNATNGLAAIQRVHYTEQIYQFYKQFQLNEDAVNYLKKLRELSKETNKDMKSASAEINIPKDEIDKYVDQILKDNNTEIIFARIIEACTPRVDEVKEELESLSKTAPLQFVLSRDLLDKKGRRVARIQPFAKDFESHLFLYLSNSLRISTFFLHCIFEEAINREIFTIHELMKFMQKSCIIEKDRFLILQKGFTAYFDGEYIVAIHLLIPQIEEAIRNLVEMNGGSVMVQKGDAFNLRTFDHLLSDEIIIDVLGKDKALYFRTLFTDKRGWNMRNNLAHGMLDTEDLLNKQNIDRILHAILCLGMVRFREN